jgi:hypothetical protein
MSMLPLGCLEISISRIKSAGGIDFKKGGLVETAHVCWLSMSVIAGIWACPDSTKIIDLEVLRTRLYVFL